MIDLEPFREKFLTLIFQNNFTWGINVSNITDNDIKNLFLSLKGEELILCYLSFVKNCETWFENVSQLEDLRDFVLTRWFIESKNVNFKVWIDHAKNLNEEQLSELQKYILQELPNNNSRISNFRPVGDSYVPPSKLYKDNLQGTPFKPIVIKSGNQSYKIRNPTQDAIIKITAREIDTHSKEFDEAVFMDEFIMAGSVPVIVPLEEDKRLLNSMSRHGKYGLKNTLSSNFILSIVGMATYPCRILSSIISSCNLLKIKISKLIKDNQLNNQYSFNYSEETMNKLNDLKVKLTSGVEELELTQEEMNTYLLYSDYWNEEEYNWNQVILDWGILPLTDEILILEDYISRSARTLNITVKENLMTSSKMWKYHQDMNHGFNILELSGGISVLDNTIKVGKTLPGRVLRYTSKFNVKTYHDFNLGYFGFTDMKLKFDYLLDKSYNALNEYDRNNYFQGMTFNKNINFINLIMMCAPDELLDIEKMPKLNKTLFTFLKMLKVNDALISVFPAHRYKSKETLAKKFVGFSKNIINYFFWWISRNQIPLMKTLVDQFAGVEPSAYYNTSRQVLDMYKLGAFEFVDLDTENNFNIIDQEDLILILRTLITQYWHYPPVIANINKFTKITRTLPDGNTVTEDMSLIDLKKALGFKEANNVYTLEEYDKLIKGKTSVEIAELDNQIVSSFEKTDNGNLDDLINWMNRLSWSKEKIIREFNEKYKRDRINSRKLFSDQWLENVLHLTNSNLEESTRTKAGFFSNIERVTDQGLQDVIDDIKVTRNNNKFYSEVTVRNVSSNLQTTMNLGKDNPRETKVAGNNRSERLYNIFQDLFEKKQTDSNTESQQGPSNPDQSANSHNPINDNENVGESENKNTPKFIEYASRKYDVSNPKSYYKYEYYYNYYNNELYPLQQKRLGEDFHIILHTCLARWRLFNNYLDQFNLTFNINDLIQDKVNSEEPIKNQKGKQPEGEDENKNSSKDNVTGQNISNTSNTNNDGREEKLSSDASEASRDKEGDNVEEGRNQDKNKSESETHDEYDNLSNTLIDSITSLTPDEKVIRIFELIDADSILRRNNVNIDTIDDIKLSESMEEQKELIQNYSDALLTCIKSNKSEMNECLVKIKNNLEGFSNLVKQLEEEIKNNEENYEDIFQTYLKNNLDSVVDENDYKNKFTERLNSKRESLSINRNTLDLLSKWQYQKN